MGDMLSTGVTGLLAFQTALDTIQTKVLKGSSSLLAFTTSLLTSAASVG